MLTAEWYIVFIPWLRVPQYKVKRQITRHFHFTSAFYDVNIFFIYETSLCIRQIFVTCLFETMNDSLYVFICLHSYRRLALNILMQHFKGKTRHTGCKFVHITCNVQVQFSRCWVTFLTPRSPDLAPRKSHFSTELFSILYMKRRTSLATAATRHRISSLKSCIRVTLTSPWRASGTLLL